MRIGIREQLGLVILFTSLLPLLVLALATVSYFRLPYSFYA